MCAWCWFRSRGWHLSYGRLWTWWRTRHYCARCSPPRESRVGRLAIAHNAIMREIRELHEAVMAAQQPAPADGE